MNERTNDKSACVIGNFEEVTLCPGASAICVTEPCTALFQMLPGKGEYQVTSNNLDLSAFWLGTHYIEVQESDAQAALFWVDNP